ncbi:MAG: GGDEF domain-containing protein [Chloroflexi bacterium]|nr:GGDEF domain-containing protein [Chloroflexota bacterium]
MGTIVLLGWWLDVDTLKGLWPGLLTMKPNTAVCFLLMGAGVVALARPAIAGRHRVAGTVLVGAAAGLAAATLSQYLTSRDLGIDQLLFREPAGQIGTVVAGRMAPMTGVCFVLLAVAALVRTRAPRLVLFLCGAALALAALNVFDFVFDARAPTFLAGSTQMALNTALTIGVLAIAIIGLLGAADPFKSLTGPSSTGILFRRLLVISIAAPILMAGLRLQGQRLGWYDTSYGISLMLVGTIGLGLVAILKLAGSARAEETKRQGAELERDRFFELSLDLLVVFDADGRFQKVNRSWERLMGYPDGALIGRSSFDLLHPDDRERTMAEAERHFGEGEEIRGFENRYRHADGTYRWLEWMSRMSPDLSVAYAVARDVSERRRRDDRRHHREQVLVAQNTTLTEHAIRDPLTGLHNRRYFDEAVPRLERSWRRDRAAEPPPVSVILFDLDHFGKINKQHGHQVGDAVLREFGRMLRERFRGNDLVARYGGEEFVAILVGSTSADAVRIAEGIRAEFEALAIDAGTDGPLRVTVSAGCAQVGDDRSTTAALTLADLWLSQAKRAGRNQVIGL